MKKLLLLVLLVVLTLASCKTRQERALRLFEKAQILDPKLVSTLDTTIIIDTLLLYKDTLFIKADTTKFKVQIEDLEKEGKQILFENEKLKVELQVIKETDGKGKVTYRREGIVTNKEKQIIRELRVPFYITKTIPAKVITKTYTIKEKHGFIWWLGFIIVVGAGVLAIYKVYTIWQLR